MRTLRIIAEAMLTNEQAADIARKGVIVWDPQKTIATIYGQPIKFVSAGIIDEEVEFCRACKGKGSTGTPPVECYKCKGSGKI